MKRSLRILDRVQVKSPCTEDWNEMVGNDEVRFCSHCSKHVHNLSAMTRREAEELVLKSNGNLCIRYLRRPEDHQIVTLPDWMDRPALRRIALPIAAGVMAVALNTPPSMAQKAEGGATIQSQMVKRGNYIDGTLVNQLGDPVPGATICCTSVLTRKSVVGLSDEKGAFQFLSLSEGDSLLEIEAQGYLSRKVEFTVYKGKTPLDLLLNSKSTQEVIGLSAEPITENKDQLCKDPENPANAQDTQCTQPDSYIHPDPSEADLISIDSRPVLTHSINNKSRIDVQALLKTMVQGPLLDLEGQKVIQGTVSDGNRGIEGAVVELFNKDTGQYDRQDTNGEGWFQFGDVEPGVYRLKVDAKNFKPWEINELNLAPGQGKEVNPMLVGELIIVGLIANIPNNLVNTNPSISCRPAGSELLRAVENRNAPTVLSFLKQGIQPNGRNEHGETALMLVGNSKTIAKYLVRYGADVNAQNQVGTTPLMYAMLQDKTFIPKLLIAGGADVNAADQWGRTALMIAAFEGKTKFIKLLIKAGADVGMKDQFGKTALDYASDANQPGVVKLLKVAETKQATTH